MRLVFFHWMEYTLHTVSFNLLVSCHLWDCYGLMIIPASLCVALPCLGKEKSFIPKKRASLGVIWVMQWRNPIRKHELAGSIPGLAQWFKDLVTMWAVAYVADWFGSCIAVAVVYTSRCRSDLTPSVGSSIYHRCGQHPKKENKLKKASQERRRHLE